MFVVGKGTMSASTSVTVLGGEGFGAGLTERQVSSNAKYGQLIVYTVRR